MVNHHRTESIMPCTLQKKIQLLESRNKKNHSSIFQKRSRPITLDPVPDPFNVSAMNMFDSSTNVPKKNHEVNL